MLWSGMLVANTSPESLMPSSPFNHVVTPARKLEPRLDFLQAGRGHRPAIVSVLTSMTYKKLLSKSRANTSPKLSRERLAGSCVLITLENGGKINQKELAFMLGFHTDNKSRKMNVQNSKSPLNLNTLSDTSLSPYTTTFPFIGLSNGVSVYE